MTIEERIQSYAKSIDTDNDGNVTSLEMDQAQRLQAQRIMDINLELSEEKSTAHRRMASAAMASIVFFTAVLFTPMVAVDRVTALSELFGLFYISCASIVGGYMGVSSWMSKK